MLEAITGKGEIAKRKKPFASGFVKYFLLPFRGGLSGFAIFFSILIFTKLFAYVVGIHEIFEVDVEDVILSVIGFILMFLIRFLENFQKRD